MNPDLVWQELVKETLRNGDVVGGPRPHRRMPGWLVRFDRTPLVSARKASWRNALREWEWLTYGKGVLLDLHPQARHWWSRWATEHGEVVPGVGFPDLEPLVAQAIASPHSRRLLFTTWSQGPCPVPRNDFIAQFSVSRGKLELFAFQRTCDLGRGAPHNWLQFWALGLWFAERVRTPFGCLRWTAGDVHVHEAHAEVLSRAASVRADLLPRSPGLIYEPRGQTFRAFDFSLDGPYAPVVCDPLEHA